MKVRSQTARIAIAGPRWWLLTAVACALPALAQTPMPASGLDFTAARPVSGDAPVSTVPDPVPLAWPVRAPQTAQLTVRAAPVASASPAAAAVGAAPALVSPGPAGAGRAIASVAPAASVPTAAAHLPAPSLPPCSSVSLDPPAMVTLGKSSVLRLSAPVVRMVVGGLPAGRSSALGDAPPPAATNVATGGAAAASADGVAQVDVVLLGPSELFVLGRRPGSMNLVLQAADGRCYVRDVIVSVDPEHLQLKLAELLPGESQIRVRAMDGTLVLTGQVSDAIKADEVMGLAQSLGEGRRVVNLLRVSAPQQVMLEVKIAEVSKGVLDRLGIDLTRVSRSGDGARIFSGLFGGNPLLLGKTATSNIGLSGRVELGRGVGLDVGAGKDTLAGSSGLQGAAGTLIGVDAQAQDALVRILAEPNIMAVSGQSASFLSGGKIYIPVRQGNGAVALDERQFGVGLKFHPTVLEGGRINLKLTAEASELSQTGAALTSADGLSSIMPTISTRQVDTTVQLGDGQSLAIAGLIRQSVSQSLSRFPGLGDLPVLGALFRSTAFQKDQTELVFVVTPRLVQPLRTAMLPTDVHVAPSRQDAVLGGKAEGTPAPTPAPRQADVPVAAPPARASSISSEQGSQP
jgi:pilus assembly protein CpaC